MSTYGYGKPSRRRHPVRVIIIVLIVLIALLVAADFAARAFAENKAASEIQQQGFPKKPSVDIQGFPFLTQVAAHQFHQIHISSTNDTEGPLDISSIDASLKNVHINGAFSGGTIGTLHGTATITFTALANAVTSQAGSLGQLANAGLTFSAGGPERGEGLTECRGVQRHGGLAGDPDLRQSHQHPARLDRRAAVFPAQPHQRHNA